MRAVYVPTGPPSSFGPRYPMAIFISRNTYLRRVWAIFAIPISVLALAIPIVAMKRPMRCFRSAKTCSRTQPGLPLKKRRGATMMTHDYKRNGATTLFAALLWFGHRLAGRRAEMSLRDRPCPWRSSSRSSLIDTPCPPRPMKRCRSCPADRPPGSRPSYRAASVAVQVRMVPAISASMAVVAIDGDGGLHHDHGRAIRALLSTLALQCPTPVTLHPAQSGRVGRPCIGKAACLQGILPGVRGAPARSLDNGGVDRPGAYGPG